MSGAGPGPAPDPSMEEILASIRRILDDDTAAEASSAEHSEELVLDATMLEPDMLEPDPAVPPSPSLHAAAPAPEPPPMPHMSPISPSPPAHGGLLNPTAADSASTALHSLARAVAAERGASVTRGGPTIEDLVREELKPMLKQWLDTYLPPLVEHLVRAEIERVGRSAL